jgi:hypothetical protein
MDKTATPAAPPPSVNGHNTAITAQPPRPVATPRPARAPKPLVIRALEIVASLRITVVLFFLALLLVFYGTLAQVDKGVWTVVADYFRCKTFVLIPLNVVLIKPILHYEGDFQGYLPYPGGWLIGGLLLINLIAAHIVSFKLTWKRSGILAIHSGIVLMMLGEFISGNWQVEGQMHIVQGESCNFVEHYRFPELAIVDASDLKKDRVVVIPTARLQRGGRIADDEGRLPFDVEVVQYMVNSRLALAEKGDLNPATRGQGLRIIAEERPEGNGVDPDQKADLAAAYVTLRRRATGEAIGTYLFAVHLAQPEEWVEVDGKAYRVSLRSKRSQKDYTFRLDKLNVSYYPNTEKPKDYSSFIHLTDPSDKVERDVRIFMNNPLTYAGETFYQSGVGQDPGTGRPMTTLQVVHNPGWMLPYLSCFLVATGMLFHFGLNLSRFIERRVA